MRTRVRYPRLWDARDMRHYLDGEPEITDVRWREFFAFAAGVAAAYTGLFWGLYR